MTKISFFKEYLRILYRGKIEKKYIYICIDVFLYIAENKHNHFNKGKQSNSSKDIFINVFLMENCRFGVRRDNIFLSNKHKFCKTKFASFFLFEREDKCLINGHAINSPFFFYQNNDNIQIITITTSR